MQCPLCAAIKAVIIISDQPGLAYCVYTLSVRYLDTQPLSKDNGARRHEVSMQVDQVSCTKECAVSNAAVNK